MGLGVRFLQVMTWLRKEGYFAPGQKVMEIGAQQLNNQFLKATDEIEQLCRLFNVPIPPLPSPVGDGPDHVLDPSAPRARDFYRSLGFDYACIDVDNDYESIDLDLNFDSVPPSLAGQFHLVTNFGTTEHVINQFNAFKIVHDLAAPGAIMLHELPAFDQINHGFFGYTPKFLNRLSYSNQYSRLMFDFSWGDLEYGIPDELREQLAQYVDLTGRPQFGHSPSTMTIVLRKTGEAPFVPPIDFPYGSKAPNERMKERYGNAFRPLPLPVRLIGKVAAAWANARRFVAK